MRFSLILKFLILLQFYGVQFLYSQTVVPTSPLEPSSKIEAIKIGFIVGSNIPVSPDVLVDKPTTATKKYRNHCLTDLTGLDMELLSILV